MWIDKVIVFEPHKRLVAVKNVSLAEEHLHQHFAAEGVLPPCPVMPNSLILEGMAQTAGILTGSLRRFKEKVVLAKIQKAEITQDVVPGQCIRYDARIERIDPMGAGTVGTIERFDHRTGQWEKIGETEIMFSHVDQNMSGLAFPEHNFVFSDSFRNVLRASGLGHLMD